MEIMEARAKKLV